MIYKSFKVSDADESVLDHNEILMVELKNDNVQSFNTRWNETIIAMKKQTYEEILETILFRQLQLSDQQKPLLSLYNQDTVQKGESRDYARLKKMAVRYLEQKDREKHFSSRERQLENLKKPASGATAAKGKSKGKGKRNCGALEWISVA